MLKPKLPLVSNSRILAPSARLSHTLIRPSKDVAARYCPSSDRAIAHISPALFPSASDQHALGQDIDLDLGKKSRTYNLALLTPVPFFHCPYFHLASKAYTRCYLAISACCEVVAAEFMGFLEGLRQGKVGSGS